MPQHKISAYFLGSTWKPTDQPNPGAPYKNDKEVYFKTVTSKKNNEENVKTNFIFIGPTLFDIIKPNVKSLSQKGENIINNYVSSLLETASIIEIKIKGYSRGGIIAKFVYQKLKDKFGSNKRVKFGPLIVSDPYAGPFNSLSKSNDTIDDVDDANINSVYSLNSGRIYGPPATALTSKIIVFTDCSHGKTKYIAQGITKLSPGTYYFDGTQKELLAFEKRLKSRINIIDEATAIKNEIKKYVKDHTKKISTHRDCYKALTRFHKVSTGRIKKIFYTRLSKMDDGKYQYLVERYLKDNKQSRLAKSIIKG